jgi:hypothetical protein
VISRRHKETVYRNGSSPDISRTNSSLTGNDDQITIESEVFEHRAVKPHFINFTTCCFGEDLAVWLKQQLLPLATAGFEISDPIQEDYDGALATKGRDPFWIALSFCRRRSPTDEPAQWVYPFRTIPG